MGEHGCVPFSSGIAVGTHGGPDASGSPTAVMYDFAGRCSNWFQYLGDNDNTPTLQQVYTTYTGTEAEDDECDNVTFKVPVVWVRDHEDNIFRAFETPVCFLGGGVAVAKTNRMTGGGGLPIVYPTSLQGQQAHNGFMLHCYSFDQPDNLEITWGNGNSFHLTNDTSSLCDNDPNATGSSGASFNHIHGFGTGRANGQPGATVKWSFTDNGEPGTNDYGDITVEVPLSQMPACTNIDPSTLTDPTSEMCVVMHAQGNLMPGPLMGEGNYQAHDAG
jgi:hypothetical protein